MEKRPAAGDAPARPRRKTVPSEKGGHRSQRAGRFAAMRGKRWFRLPDKRGNHESVSAGKDAQAARPDPFAAPFVVAVLPVVGADCGHGTCPANASGVAVRRGGAVFRQARQREPRRDAPSGARVDQHQGSLPRLLSGPRRRHPARPGHGLVPAGRRARAPHFRIHPAHPAHRVDSADHLLVRHRPDGQGVHHLDRRHRALRHQFLCGRAHDQSGLSPDGQALRRDELAAFLDRSRSRWRGAG